MVKKKAPSGPAAAEKGGGGKSKPARKPTAREVAKKAATQERQQAKKAATAARKAEQKAARKVRVRGERLLREQAKKEEKKKERADKEQRTAEQAAARRLPPRGAAADGTATDEAMLDVLGAAAYTAAASAESLGPAMRAGGDKDVGARGQPARQHRIRAEPLAALGVEQQRRGRERVARACVRLREARQRVAHQEGAAAQRQLQRERGLRLFEEKQLFVSKRSGPHFLDC